MISYYNMSGRFGNLLFSIYTVYYYCFKNNIDISNIIFNKDGFSECGNNVEKYIDFFVKIKDKFINYDEWNKITKNNINIEYQENLDYKNNITFCGCYWKYPQPKIDVERKILLDIFYDEKLYNNVLQKAKIDLNDSLAIHVRRTDFVDLNLAESVNDISMNIKNYKKYLIFSDDIEWCKNNIKCNENIYFIDNSYNLNDYEQFILMSMCTDVCIHTRSSYSIFASILNECLKINNIIKSKNKIFIKRKQMIPKNLFFIWLGGNKPNYVDFVVKTFKEVNPDFNVQLIEYTSEEIEKICSYEIGKMNCHIKYEHDYLLNWSFHNLKDLEGEKINFLTHLSNVYRYVIINKFGGIYLDCDTFPIKPFDDELLCLENFTCTRSSEYSCKIVDDAFFMGTQINPTGIEYYNKLYPNLEKSTDLIDKFLNCDLKYGEYFGDITHNYIDHYSIKEWKKINPCKFNGIYNTF